MVPFDVLKNKVQQLVNNYCTCTTNLLIPDERNSVIVSDNFTLVIFNHAFKYDGPEGIVRRIDDIEKFSGQACFHGELIATLSHEEVLILQSIFDERRKAIKREDELYKERRLKEFFYGKK